MSRREVSKIEDTSLRVERFHFEVGSRFEVVFLPCSCFGSGGGVQVVFRVADGRPQVLKFE